MPTGSVMKSESSFDARSLAPSEYVLALHEPADTVAVLRRHRARGQALRRITSADAVASLEFQRWLKEQNRARSDVYVTWNRTGWFVPREDARGRITSHRARSTIATQLFNAKQPLSLFELQAWLGHSSPHSTQHYARISPTNSRVPILTLLTSDATCAT